MLFKIITEMLDINNAIDVNVVTVIFIGIFILLAIISNIPTNILPSTNEFFIAYCLYPILIMLYVSVA